eukprot:EG_transcript_6109
MRFGRCTNVNECDWAQYVQHLVWVGLSSSIPLSTCSFPESKKAPQAVLCCDCCRSASPTEHTLKRYSGLARVVRGLLVSVSPLLGIAGFTLALLGWFKADSNYSNGWNLYDVGISALQQIGSEAASFVDVLWQELSSFLSLLAVDSDELDTKPDLSSLQQDIQGIADNVGDARVIADLLTVAYKWTVLPVAVCAFAMLGLNIVAGVIHIRRSCLLATIYLGVVINLCCWLTVSITLMVRTVALDVCSDIRDVQHDPSLLQKWGLMVSDVSVQELDTLDVLQALVHDDGVAALRVCQRQHPECIGTVTPCSEYPPLCQALQAQALVTVYVEYSARADCGQNCTVAQCAKQCQDPSLAAAAQQLLNLRQTIQGLKGPVGVLLSLVDPGPSYYQALLSRMTSICQQEATALGLEGCGLMLLGSNGLFSLLCLAALETCRRRGGGFGGGKVLAGPGDPTLVEVGEPVITADLEMNRPEAAEAVTPKVAAALGPYARITVVGAPVLETNDLGQYPTFVI